MLQLVYISTALSAVDRPLLDAILVASRANNALGGVTGLLVSGGRRFLQVLEGPPAAVRATFERIGGDARHRGIVVLGETVVAERAFGHWSMAYDDGRIEGLEEIVRKLVGRIADPNLRAQFNGFAQLHGRAA